MGLTLQPGVPLTVATLAVAGVSLAEFSNDNTVAGGLHSVAPSAVVHLTWEATQDGTTWYQVAACSVGGGGVQPSSGLGVSTTPAEQAVRLLAVQPSAVGPAVVIAPTVSAQAVTP